MSVRLSASACRIRASVGSCGSPLPRSISSSPVACSRRFAWSSLTNGYVPVSRSTGETRTIETLPTSEPARASEVTAKWIASCPRILTEPRHNSRVIPRQPDAAPERGFIVAVLAQGVDPSSELAELRELARTALVEPISELVQHRPRPERRTYLGKGKLEELKRAYKESHAEVLLVDDELDPAQQRTLE